MIIIGVLLILAVLLDGYRRVRSERSNRIRVTLTRQALNRASNPSSPAEPEKASEPNPELPNGGARVIVKSSRAAVDLNQSVPVLMESVYIAPDPAADPVEPAVEQLIPEDPIAGEPSTAAGSGSQLPAEFAEPADTAQAVAGARIEPHFADSGDELDNSAAVEPQFGNPPDDAAVDAASAAAPVIDEPVMEETFIEESCIDQPAVEAGKAKTGFSVPKSHGGGGDSGSDSRPNSAAQEVLIVNVLSRDKAGFKGQDVLQILLACDLRFGNMNIFHRYEKSNGKGPVQFSVANLVEPGSFDLDRIDSFTTPGLCFFLTLPGPDKSVTAFNYMVETAQVLVKNLNGELRDEAHSVMTQQTIEHYRQRIRDFERKQLTLQL
jgi:cell division protein ZipA